MKRKGQQGAFVVVFMIVLIIGIIVGVIGFSRVEASHRGVKVRLGEITGTMNPGLEWTGIFTSVHQYDLRTRSMTINMGELDSSVDKDGQNVYAVIEINYKLKPESAEQAYAHIGLNDELADVLRVEGRIKEGFKTVTSQYSSIEIFQRREEVRDKAIKQIDTRFPHEYFVLENVIISNIDFNPAFKAAIESRKVAEETAKAKEQEVLVNKFEADKKIETARGEAESIKLNAQAEAFSITIKAEAEALALRLKKEELTPLMVENNRIDRWNGAYPQYYMGGGSEGLNILMQMPQ